MKLQNAVNNRLKKRHYDFIRQQNETSSLTLSVPYANTILKLKDLKIKIDIPAGIDENNFEFIIIRGYHYGKDKS